MKLPPGVRPLRFALVDVDCDLPADLLRAWAEACTYQAHKDFAAPEWGYGCAAEVFVCKSVAAIPAGAVPTLLLRVPDVPGAAGYHDGSRAVKVFPLLGELADASLTLSHEVLERLADPDVSTAVVGPDRRIRLREVCDPVELDSYPVKVSSGATVRVSNFVGVDYFSGPADGAVRGNFDKLRKLSAAGELRPGGYQTFYTAKGGYTQETRGAKRPYRAALDYIANLGGHRTRAAMAKGLGPEQRAPRLVDRFGVEVPS